MNRQNPLQALTRSQMWGGILALAVILLFNAIINPTFFHLEIKGGNLYGSLVDVLKRAAPIMLMAIGMTLAISTKGIDISVGSIAAIASATAAVLIAKADAPLWLVIVLPIAVAMVLGAWNGFLISVIGVQPIIATLIMMVMGRGVAQLITDGQVIPFHSPGFAMLGSGYFLGLPFALTIVAIVLLVAGLYLRRTAMGLFIESIGINQKAAHNSGIDTKLIVFMIYVGVAMCAAMAGLIYASDIKAADANTCGLNTELDAILAVVIGGTSMVDGGRFTLVGSIIGALVVQSLTTTILTLGVPVEFTLVVRALVVFLICFIQSEDFRSLLGRRIKTWRARRIAKARETRSAA